VPAAEYAARHRESDLACGLWPWQPAAAGEPGKQARTNLTGMGIGVCTAEVRRAGARMRQPPSTQD